MQLREALGKNCPFSNLERKIRRGKASVEAPVFDLFIEQVTLCKI